MRIKDLQLNPRRFWVLFEKRIGQWSNRDFPAEARAAVEERATLKERQLAKKGRPNFENTIGFLEGVALSYSRVLGDFHGLSGVVRNSRLEGFEEEIARVEEEEERKDLGDDRWAKRVRQMWRANRGGISDKRRKLMEDYYLGYKNSGAYLPAKTRAEVARLNAVLGRLELKFSQRLAKERRHVVFPSSSSLDGLSGDEIAQARELARSIGEGGWALRLDPTICQDVGRRMVNVRSKLRLSREAARRGGRLEDLTIRIAKSRLQIAKLLGFESWGHLKLQDGAAKRPENVWGTFSKCLPIIRKMAKGDILLAKGAGWRSGDMDERDIWSFLPAGASVPSYEPDKVLKKGCFSAGSKLFGLDFRRIEDCTLYHPDVQAYAVGWKGKTIGFIIVDFWQRNGKDDGAWALAWESLRDGRNFPVVSLCFNFARHGKCDFSGVTTIFHEFGHALHAIFTAELAPSHVGLECSNDFVETPSQLAEHWAYDESLYNSYRSEGSPPHSEVLKIEPGTGLAYLASMISAGADLIWHGSKLGRVTSSKSIDRQARKRLADGICAITPRYKSSYFEHIFSCGYDASYYSYLWCELKAGQVNNWAKENGGLTKRVGRRVLQSVYQAGGHVRRAGENELWSKRKKLLFFENR